MTEQIDQHASGERLYEFYRAKTSNMLFKWARLSNDEHDWWSNLEDGAAGMVSAVIATRESIVTFIRAKSNEIGEKAKDDPRLLMLQAMAAYGHDLARMISDQEDIPPLPVVDDT